MRDFKFRVWDYLEEKMIPSENAMVQDNRVFTLYTDRTMIENFNYELMQYTNLRDQNGIEIYEGDILRDEADGEEYGVVEFNEGSFVVCWRGAYIIEQLLSEVHDSCCIIGNIHNNPELIKDKKDEH